MLKPLVLRFLFAILVANVPKQEKVNVKFGKIRSSQEAVQPMEYATISGKRLFVVLNLFNKVGLKLQEDEERKYDTENRHAYKDIDTVEITIPSGDRVEALPKEVAIQNKFGTYSSSVKYPNNQFTLLRTHEKFPWHFPKDDYPEL